MAYISTENLNVGDTVFADFTEYSTVKVSRGTIVAKSANGTIRADFGRKHAMTGAALLQSFKPDGTQRDPSNKWHPARLITEAHYNDRMAVMRQQNRDRELRVKLKALSETSISRIDDLIAGLEATLEIARKIKDENNG